MNSVANRNALREKLEELAKEDAIKWMDKTDIGLVAEGCYTYARDNELGFDKTIHKKTLLKGAVVFGLRFAFHPSLANPKYRIQLNLWIDGRPRAETIVSFGKSAQPAFHWIEADLLDQATNRLRGYKEPFRFGKRDLKVIAQAATIDPANKKGRPLLFGPKITYVWIYKDYSLEPVIFEQIQQRYEDERYESPPESSEQEEVAKSAPGITHKTAKPPHFLGPSRSKPLFKQFPAPAPTPKRKLSVENSDDEGEAPPSKRVAPNKPVRPSLTLAAAPAPALARPALQTPTAARATPTRPSWTRTKLTKSAQLAPSKRPAQPTTSAPPAVTPTARPAAAIKAPPITSFSSLLASVAPTYPSKKRLASEAPAAIQPPAKVPRLNAATKTTPITPTIPTPKTKASLPVTPKYSRQPAPSHASATKPDLSPQWFVSEGTSFPNTPLGNLQKWLYTRASRPTAAELQELGSLFANLGDANLASREKVQAEKLLSIFTFVKDLRGDGKPTDRAAKKVLEKLGLAAREREYSVEIVRAAKMKDPGTKWVREAIVRTLNARSKVPGATVSKA